MAGAGQPIGATFIQGFFLMSKDFGIVCVWWPQGWSILLRPSNFGPQQIAGRSGVPLDRGAS
jgi:hypothetical protein